MDPSSFDRRHLIGSALAAPVALSLASAAQAQPTSPATTLKVIAEIVAKPEHADALRAVLTPFAANARKEPGCLAYALYEDRGQPGRFFTDETWTGDAALDAHLNSPAMKAGATQLAAMLASPPAIHRLNTLAG